MALLLALLPLPVSAQSFPQFTGFVVDAADVIPPAEKAALTAKLDALQKSTGHQLIVATIPDLQGYPIEDYGYRLGRAWGVGLKGANNGTILIVAPNDRKVRVEVGYGLEPVLTDALSGLIVQGKIIPAFKAGDIPGGIAAGTDALIEQLSLPDAEAKQRVAAAAADYDKAHAHHGDDGVPFGLIFWGIILAFVILSHFRRGAGGRRYRGGLWPLFLWGPGSGGSWSGGSGWGGGSDWGGGSSGGGGWGGGGFGGGGGGSFGGGGASGSW